MIEKQQFCNETILNIENQEFEVDSISIHYWLWFIDEIYLEYLYQVAPQVAILHDPNILDMTRRMIPKCQLCLNKENSI